MSAVPPGPLRFIGRVLSGRFTARDIDATTARHLIAGLLFTWAAGVGRYWDSPRASTLQHLGLGSIVYVLALSAFLWLLLLPLRPRRWPFVRLLTFICAVSPPAVLYAIPVEQFLSLAGARRANVWFLAIVATWRVALYLIFLIRYAGFRNLRLAVAALLPLTIIIAGLTALNLEKAVFDLMAGLHPSGTSADSAYQILFLLTLISVRLAPVLALLYIAAVGMAYKAGRDEKGDV
ncbi:MAG TPA: hypothetical protein VEK57_29745 [Thermoanaerobaculia bacterium]|nr:hypothetical protein [Thermoanaerobaculia bacterium]